MIVVKKGLEPDGLKELREDPSVARLAPKDAYKMLMNPLKQEVIDSLKHDQGQLCVYCMCRIPRNDKDPENPGFTIEHFIPLVPADGRDVGQALDYQNLFIVCHGNEKRHKKGTRRDRAGDALTCDKHRKNTEFKKINPCDEATLSSIFYSVTDGKIDSNDPEVRYDLINTLNLNCASSPVVSERKAALDALIYDLGQIEENKLGSYCQKQLEAFLNEKDPKTPYVGILIWYLKTMINALLRDSV